MYFDVYDGTISYINVQIMKPYKLFKGAHYSFICIIKYS